MRIENMIAAVQKKLGVQVDGRAGPETWGAIYARIVKGAGPRRAPAVDRVDERSEKAIATLLPEVRPIARALVHKAATAGIRIKVISGTRTFQAQDRLFAQGRTRPGRRVTNARGGFSNHNFGIAFDIGIFSGTRYLDDSPLYKAAGALGRAIGLEWGGDWRSIVDEPHFQLRPKWAANISERELLTELRRRHEVGQDAFA